MEKMDNGGQNSSIIEDGMFASMNDD